MSLIFTLLLPLILAFVQVGAEPPPGADYKLRYERMSFMNGTRNTVIDFQTLRVRRFNATTYVVNGSFELLVDGEDSYQGSIETYRSEKGNDDFELVPMNLPIKDVCGFMDTGYRKYIMPSLNSDNSNLPVLDENEKPPCPLPKGQYYVKNYLIPDDKLPLHMDPGLWRADIIFYKGENEQVTGIQVFVKIEPKSGI